MVQLLQSDDGEYSITDGRIQTPDGRSVEATRDIPDVGWKVFADITGSVEDYRRLAKEYFQKCKGMDDPQIQGTEHTIYLPKEALLGVLQMKVQELNTEAHKYEEQIPSLRKQARILADIEHRINETEGRR